MSPNFLPLSKPAFNSIKLYWLWLIRISHPWQHHAFSLKGHVLLFFQIWKCEESLDRDLLLCGAAGREIYQVKAG